MTQPDAEIEHATKLLAGTQSLLVITGAGISAESGLPTYRGPGGVYSRHPELEHALTAEGLARDPDAVWGFINEFRIKVAAAQPNAAHRVLARWETANRFSRFLIATQNIDGLHQAAGSSRVTELHGRVWQVACPREVDYTEDDEFSREAQDFLAGSDPESILRKWSEENHQKIWETRDVPFRQIPPYTDPAVRPNVLLFDEPYGNRLLWVHAFIDRKPDTILVIGCSGEVCILERLLRLCRYANPGCQIININPSQSGIQFEHTDIRMTAVEAMNRLDRVLG